MQLSNSGGIPRRKGGSVHGPVEPERDRHRRGLGPRPCHRPPPGGRGRRRRGGGPAGPRGRDRPRGRCGRPRSPCALRDGRRHRRGHRPGGRGRRAGGRAAAGAGQLRRRGDAGQARGSRRAAVRRGAEPGPGDQRGRHRVDDGPGRRRDEGAGAARRGPRRHRQYRLRGGLRRADRPDRVLRLQGRRGRADPARGPRARLLADPRGHDRPRSDGDAHDGRPARGRPRGAVHQDPASAPCR